GGRGAQHDLTGRSSQRRFDGAAAQAAPAELRAHGRGDRLRGLGQRRLTIAYRRAACWSRTREELEVVAHKLSTILELIQLMHEQSTTPVDSPTTCAEI